ncbi:DMT family transporter [Silvimonas sp. JCM 19000]
MHASWNAVVKSGPDKMMSAVLVTASAGAIAALVLPVLPQPARVSLPYIAASSMVQVAYIYLVARAYSLADMSQAYPVMRGSAPLLVAAVSYLWLGERLHPAAWLGIGLISAGVLAMAAVGRAGRRDGIGVALCNAGFIAAYTLIDGHGVRLSGAAAAYTLWMFVLTGSVLAAAMLLTRPTDTWQYARRHWRFGLIGGIGTLCSYGLSLWAMTVAPVAVIAALRETSILFGTAISLWVLKEQISRRRLLAIGIIALGAVTLRLA